GLSGGKSRPQRGENSNEDGACSRRAGLRHRRRKRHRRADAGGARLKADVFRPGDTGTLPAILNLGPYQQDKLWIPPGKLEGKPNPLMNWETVNPRWWVPNGYAAVRVDGRGSGKSPGECEPWSLAESIDLYDAIEWAAAQPWCSGKVGLSGISYFAINQWF